MITQIKDRIIQIKDEILEMQGEQNRKVLIIGAGVIILLLLDLFLVFLPLVKKSFDLKSQIVSVKKNISTLNQQIVSLDATKKRLEILKNDQIMYETKFPKEEEVPALLGRLSTIAGKLGVEIIAVKPVKIELRGGADETVGLFHEVPIEISAKAGYHQIGQFINKLETLDKFIKIQDVEITPDRATPRRHFFRVLVLTYILKV